MVSRKKNDPNEQPSEHTADRVQLGPLFGFTPHQYVPVLYLSAVILLLFAVLILPGILRYGEHVRFDGYPLGAEVYLNGTRVGSTPVESYVPAGRYELEFRKAFLQSHLQEIEVSGRVFGSLLFPRRSRHSVRLVLPDSSITAVVRHAVREYAAWAAVGQSSRRHRFPPVLSESMDTLMTAATEHGLEQIAPSSQRVAAGLIMLEQAAGHTVDAGLLRDYVRAVSMLAGPGPAAGPGALVESVQFFVQLHNNSEALPVLLAEALPREEALQLSSGAGFRTFLERKTTAMVAASYEELPTEVDTFRSLVADIAFARVPSGVVPLGQSRQGREPAVLQLPFTVELQSFDIMEHAVTRAQYAEFLSEQPYWHRDNIDVLIEAGYVTRDYLRDWEDSLNPELPISYVSHYAAEAYAEWFGNKIGAGERGLQVRLPHEAEFEWATLLDGSDLFPGNFRDRPNAGPRPATDGEPGNLGLYHMMGNVWEWQSSYYAPAAYLLGEAVDVYGVERVVRGGAWVNSSNEVEPATRGGQHPRWCSPFLGFRLVIAEKDAG